MLSSLGDQFKPMLPAVLAGAVAVFVVGALHWPLPLHMADTLPVAAFHEVNLWAFQLQADMVLGRHPYGLITDRINYPEAACVGFINWLPALLVAPLQGSWGPIKAYNFFLLLGPLLSVGVAWLSLRRLFGARPWPAAAGALAYCLCPFFLGSLANGQLAKFQAWILPAFLLGLNGALRGGWIRGPLVLGLLTIAIAFTSPSQTLLLPFVMLAWGAAVCWQERRLLLLRGLLATAVVASICLLGMVYYKLGAHFNDVDAAFKPARFFSTLANPYPTTVAWPLQTLLGTGIRQSLPDTTVHVTYLGLPLLLGAAFLSRRPFLHRWTLWVGFILGLMLALGPRLSGPDGYLVWHGKGLALPAVLLHKLGYPLANGGMYYRAIMLASFCLAAIISVAGTAWGRRGVWLAGLLALLSVADGLRATHSLWPRPMSTMTSLPFFQEMAKDPIPGAVLALPVDTNPTIAGHFLAAATIHGRPTTAIPNFTSADKNKTKATLQALVTTALNSGTPQSSQAILHDAGYRYVLAQDRNCQPNGKLAGLEGALGPPTWKADFYVWTLNEDGTGAAPPAAMTAPHP